MVRETIHTQTLELSNQQLGLQPNRVCSRHRRTCQHLPANRTTQEQQEKAG